MSWTSGEYSELRIHKCWRLVGVSPETDVFELPRHCISGLCQRALGANHKLLAAVACRL